MTGCALPVDQRGVSRVGQAARNLSITSFGGLTVYEGRFHTTRLGCEYICEYRGAYVRVWASVSVSVCVQRAKEQTNYRQYLLKIFISLKFIGQQGLAVHGHTSNTGNLEQLFLLRAEDDNILKDWMMRSRNWTSHDILNEMLQIMAHDILRQLVGKARKSYYALVVDETTDMANKEQVSLCLRTVDEKLNVEEDFVGFYEKSSTTFEVLVRVIKDVLLRLVVKLNRCRGHTYDSAASMSGVNTRVAARIAAEEKRALNTKCLAHSLNLAVQDAIKSNSLIGDLQVAMQELSNFISSSAKRLGIFEKIQEELSPKAPSLKPLCLTRWTVRYVALLDVQANFESILCAL